MYTILRKRTLAEGILYQMSVHAPFIAQSAQLGQFVIVIPRANGERIPLTICDFDPVQQSVDIVFQVVGHTTRLLSTFAEGDSLYAIAGPLGRPGHLLSLHLQQPSPLKRLLFVAGGVGIAPIFPQVKWAALQGIPSDVIVGARNRDLLFFLDPLRQLCQNLYIMTDDGSLGEQGLVTDKLHQLCQPTTPYSHCIAIGPLPMMKYVCLATKQYQLPTIVSLNCMMVDGTGMCGACRVKVGGEVKFCCVDGPEFDGHLVDYDDADRKLHSPDAHRYRIATSDSHHQCHLAPAVESTLTQAATTTSRQHPQEQDPHLRASNFAEVNLGFTPQQALLEASRCLQCKRPRCVEACPVGINIPRFIAHIKQGDPDQAYSVISLDSALPAVCGRVCPQETQCEGACVMGIKNDPIAIGALERYAADHHRLHAAPSPIATPTGPKVAIIGSGPSGLTCAADLATHGCRVTIFEALHRPGGVLAYGIPEFRLPKQQVVAPEIDRLRSLGVDIQTNVVIGRSLTIDQLFAEQDFAAVYIASGAGLPKFMGIPGETLVGVLSANELLTRANLMHAYDTHFDTPLVLGHRVVVVGGGNVAMDAARTALRLGSEVTVVYRRGQADMPARREEVTHAMEEGIQFLFQTAPVEVLPAPDGTVQSLRCIRMALGQADQGGRRSFSPVAGSEFELQADTIVAALGTSPNPLIGSTTPGLDCHPWGGIVADSEGRTSRPLVFAGGDAVSGAATVILAMGAGRKAARAILESMHLD
ncbi:MAG: NADPH-dependent glutamate synthase [Bacteroidales bacterium]|nr:NADPH-dependent glutamate synthase [Bacteroidales bacterium]